MSWLYRLLKRNTAETLITMDTAVTSGITIPALTVTGTTTQTGVATFAAAPVFSGTSTFTGAATFTAAPIVTPGTATSYTATDPSYIIATVGGIDIIIGNINSITAACIPAHIGDVLINKHTGKMYIAGAAAASTDWKIVTSA